ncbi:hypothetical protein ASPZODRAFT_18501 [Penicilliopsis zonata CBS 506.65]|uniref:Uncharacterized protein n=1 Tax=Penicilliopsis zonata CBS 506.65 TaxID=1073090 RepID=A0A1L9SAX9_9EURO|nr:hypothetical protein ASPZODRAFT_18501 [Penicilliopsis zonata CBS 506.65]OJJ44301.1 hypothetical protein ASPZODRAFT_18501 [Penicilliopsis zonata CBS 506.65]
MSPSTHAYWRNALFALRPLGMSQDEPLPSLHLLQMQWGLHRLTALCGGASIPKPLNPYYDDERDDHSELEFDYLDSDD